MYPAVLKTPHLASPINGVGARGVISKRIQIEREGSLVSDLNFPAHNPECVKSKDAFSLIHNFYQIPKLKGCVAYRFQRKFAINHGSIK